MEQQLDRLVSKKSKTKETGMRTGKGTIAHICSIHEDQPTNEQQKNKLVGSVASVARFVVDKTGHKVQTTKHKANS